ncbi:MAG: hypothetical protein IJS47_01185 [Clostridia bacterium]|nr:hypothetical protein [Clostridia bacterium]
MSDKQRERKVDKDRYKKKQKKKKAKNKLHKAMAISRGNRNYIRKQIRPYYNALRDYLNKSVLIVLKDTDNMEKILFKIDSIGKEMSFISIPIISDDMLEEYFTSTRFFEQEDSKYIIKSGDNTIKDFIKYFFAVDAEEVINLDRLLILKNCKILAKKDGFVTLNVRPYDVTTWYCGDTTTLNGYRIFKGKKLKTFFNTSLDLSKVCIHYDTLALILMYRSFVGKINGNEFLADNAFLAQRHFLQPGYLYLAFYNDEETIYKRFKNEKTKTQNSIHKNKVSMHTNMDTLFL